MKKILAMVLTLLLVAIMLPVTAMAEGADSENAGPVEVWTGFSGTKVASYASIEEAVENLGENKWIVIGKDYTLENDFTIPDGVFLDVASGATLTVKEGVTLTVAANAKRLGIRDGGTVINNGTIMLRGGDKLIGKVALLSGSTIAALKGNPLSVPDGYFLDNNGGQNFFASKAVYEITFTDGMVKLTADSNNVTGNVKQVKLLADVVVGGWSVGTNINTDWVLDLNGHTISTSSGVTISGNKVTIENGTIKYNGTTKGAINSGNDLIIASDAVIDGGNGYAIWPSGYEHTLTVYGTVKSNGDYAITGNGSENGNLIADCNYTIQNGAVVSAPNGIAIYHPGLGTVTINGGEISGHTGVEMCAGKLVVNGGNITSTGANANATGSQNAILDGAAISIINRNYPGGTPTAEIKGGTIKATGEGALAVKAYDYKNNAVAEWTDAPQSVSVTGGVFYGQTEEIVKFIPEDYIKTDYDNTGALVKPKNITIIVPSEGDSTTTTTPGTTPNPSTGANDLVGVAAAAAAMALLGSAVLLRKK